MSFSGVGGSATESGLFTTPASFSPARAAASGARKSGTARPVAAAPASAMKRRRLRYVFLSVISDDRMPAAFLISMAGSCLPPHFYHIGGGRPNRAFFDFIRVPPPARRLLRRRPGGLAPGKKRPAAPALRLGRADVALPGAP